MKIAIYPGSFSPWHDGHTDVALQALRVFNRVIVAQGINPDKNNEPEEDFSKIKAQFGKFISFIAYDTTLVNFLSEFLDDENDYAVIRGLRNIQDFEYEKTQQYWNEDLGITIPTFYIIANRRLTHISSSAIRSVESFKK